MSANSLPYVVDSEFCERCEERHAVAGDHLCTSCRENADEAAYERSVSDFYGGSESTSERLERQVRESGGRLP